MHSDAQEHFGGKIALTFWAIERLPKIEIQVKWVKNTSFRQFLISLIRNDNFWYKLFQKIVISGFKKGQKTHEMTIFVLKSAFLAYKFGFPSISLGQIYHYIVENVRLCVSNDVMVGEFGGIQYFDLLGHFFIEKKPVFDEN